MRVRIVDWSCQVRRYSRIERRSRSSDALLPRAVKGMSIPGLAETAIRGNVRANPGRHSRWRFPSPSAPPGRPEPTEARPGMNRFALPVEPGMPPPIPCGSPLKNAIQFRREAEHPAGRSTAASRAIRSRHGVTLPGFHGVFDARQVASEHRSFANGPAAKIIEQLLVRRNGFGRRE